MDMTVALLLCSLPCSLEPPGRAAKLHEGWDCILLFTVSPEPPMILACGRSLRGNYGINEYLPHWTGRGGTVFIMFAYSETFSGCSKKHSGFFLSFF